MYSRNRIWQAGDIPTAAHFNNIEDGIFNSDAGRICFSPSSFIEDTSTYLFDTGGRFSFSDGEMFTFCVNDVNKRSAKISIDNKLVRPVYTSAGGKLLDVLSGRIFPGRIYSTYYCQADDCFILDAGRLYVLYHGKTTSNTVEEIFVSGCDGCRFSVLSRSVVAFNALAAARRDSDGASATWSLSGTIKHDGNNAVLAGAVDKVFLGGDAVIQGYDVYAQANNTYKALAFTVKGGIWESVSWNISVDYAQNNI